MSAAAYVYQGLWVNWDQSAVLGARITLPVAKATIFIAFITLFVTIAGNRTWEILRFVFHQRNATIGPKDAFHQQSQIILRNTDNTMGTLWEFSRLIYYWRSKSSFWSLISRSGLVLILAFIHIAGWTVAAGFSSQVARALDDRVLVRSPDCGLYIDLSVATTFSPAAGFQARLQNSTRVADEYVQTCYNTTGSSNALCQKFVQQEIKWEAHTNSSCPFATGVCLGGDTAAYEMDTGMIDSHKHLGLNSPPRNRVLYRRKTTCSPLVTSSYGELVNGTLPGEEFALYHYGGVGGDNVTYMVSTYAQHANAGYLLEGSVALGGGGTSNDSTTSGFDPIPDIARQDADLSIFFLSQTSLQYTGPVDDIFFSAHKDPKRLEIVPGDVHYLYRNDRMVSVMGCIDQHQLCNPNSPGGSKCTPLGPAYIPTEEIDKLGFNAQQNDTSFVIRSSISDTELLNSVAGRGGTALKAQKTVFDGINTRLPNNQWHIEVGSWFNIALARTQHAILEWSTGPAFTDSGKYHRMNLPKLYGATCSLQKVRQSGAYLSFSALGLVIIFVVGSIVILVSFFLETLVGRLQGEGGRGFYRKITWICDDKLQLSRMANEGRGIGHWERCADAVPVTSSLEPLGTISAADPNHPVLERRADVVSSTSSLELGAMPTANPSHPFREHTNDMQVQPNSHSACRESPPDAEPMKDHDQSEPSGDATAPVGVVAEIVASEQSGGESGASWAPTAENP